MGRILQLLIGGVAALALLVVGVAAGGQAGSGTIPVQAPGQEEAPQDQAPQEGPIEILIVQGYVKSIDQENLTLTAPGAPADLPLRLAPDTRFIQEESDISREELHEGSLVRAALVPMGEEFLAVVVELVPEDEQQPGGQEAQPEQPEEPAPEAQPEDTAPPAQL